MLLPSAANNSNNNTSSSSTMMISVLEAYFDDAHAIQLALVDHRPSQVWRVKRAVYDIMFSSPASTDQRAIVTHATQIVADIRAPNSPAAMLQLKADIRAVMLEAYVAAHAKRRLALGAEHKRRRAIVIGDVAHAIPFLITRIAGAASTPQQFVADAIDAAVARSGPLNAARVLPDPFLPDAEFDIQFRQRAIIWVLRAIDRYHARLRAASALQARRALARAQAIAARAASIAAKAAHLAALAATKADDAARTAAAAAAAAASAGAGAAKRAPRADALPE
jgi:hypothetical protein